VSKKITNPWVAGSLIEGGLGGLALGHPGVAATAAAVLGAGMGTRKIADILARQPLEAANEATLARSPLGQAMPPTPAGQRGMASPVAAMMLGLQPYLRPQSSASPQPSD
jgi:hypothetical protein